MHGRWALITQRLFIFSSNGKPASFSLTAGCVPGRRFLHVALRSVSCSRISLPVSCG